MDQGFARWTAALLIVLVGSGCNKFGGTPDSPQAAASTPGPERVIADFLEAVRTGDDRKAAGLLTPLARQRTSEMQMVVAPPGSDTAKFQVHDVELLADGAHVTTDWTDLDSDGRQHTDQIVWILRRDPEGWRIAGMATKVFADQDPVVLNFEDPAEMLRKQQQAEDEIARRDRMRSPPTTGSAEESPRSIR